MSDMKKHNLVIIITYFEDAQENVLKSIHFICEPGIRWEEAMDSAFRYVKREPSVRMDHYESIMAYLTHASREAIGINENVVFIERRCG